MTDDPARPRNHLPPASEFLYWPPQFQAYGYRIVDQLFQSRVVRRGDRVAPLAYGIEPDISYVVDGTRRTVGDFMDHNVVAGLLVLKDGAVVLERYGLGLRPQDRWSTMSTIKSVTAMLVGACVQDGVLDGIDDPVSRFLPKLADCDYADVTLRHLMTMSSGLDWSEVYSDPQSDVNRYSRHLAEGTPDGVIGLLRGLKSAHAPGTVWHYNTGDTYLLGRVLTAALGSDLAGYLSRTLWQPAGMECDAFYTLDARDGHEIAGSRAGMALRDIGRFAQFVLDDGRISDRRVVPDGWVDAALSPAFVFSGADRDFGSIGPARLHGYGYCWWIGSDGSAQALGFAGQRIFIHRAENLAMVTLSAFPQPPHAAPDQPDREQELLRFTDAVREALSR